MVVLALSVNHHACAACTSLFRFLATVGIIIGVIYGSMVALAVLVQPETREITVTIPPDRLAKQR